MNLSYSDIEHLRNCNYLELYLLMYIHTLSSYVEGSTVRVGSLPTRLEALNYYTYVP